MRVKMKETRSFAALFHNTTHVFMKNVVLKFGLLSGATAALLMGITTWFIHRDGGMDNGALFGYAGIVLSMVFVFIGVRTYREQELHGSISFGQAFVVGGLIALISCVCYVVTWMLIHQYVMPDFMEKYIAYTLEKMKTDGATEAAIQQASEEMAGFKELYKNPLYRIGMTFIEPLPIAVLVSLVSAFVFKRK